MFSDQERGTRIPGPQPDVGRYFRPQWPPASGAPVDFTQKGGGGSLGAVQAFDTVWI